MTRTKSCDYIIVGAGSAGCAMANRLSEDRNSQILLLEAGKWDRDPFIHIPVAWGRLMQTRRHDWNYFSEPTPGADNRRIDCSRGKVVGGTSSINTMAYVRGHRADFDRLAEAGLDGWSYDDVLPYFRKQESWQGKPGIFRGTNGPLLTMESSYADPLIEAYAQAAVGLGHNWTDDYNGAVQEGFGRMQLTVGRGRRSSSAVAYLHPVLSRPNLQVEVRATATGIIMQGNRAVGVRYLRNGQAREAYAGREVILCGGAFNSPQLLMLSGIGDPARLGAHGIRTVVESNGVGRNLHDHAGTSIIYERNGPGPFHRHMRMDRALRGMAEAYLFGSGFATHLPGGLTGFVKSSPDEPLPDIQLLFQAAPPDAHLYLRPFVQPYADRFVCRIVLLRPESRGEVSLNSASPLAPPRIVQSLLETEADIRRARNGMKIFREIGASPRLSELVKSELRPGPDVRSDAEIDAYLRAMVTTSYHPAGTCRMGTAGDAAAVVDSELRVLGAENLRVVDASIFPEPIGGNINAAIIMAAEKAADLIKARHSGARRQAA